MKKLFHFLIPLILLSAARGQGARVQTWVVDGNGKPVAFPVFRACTEPTSGTPCNTPASIFSDRAMTSPLSNPSTGDANSNIGFYAIQARYHLQISGAGITAFDMPDIPAYDSTNPTVSTCVVAFSATPTYDPTTCTIFAMTLTANVTSSTISNPVTGRNIQFHLCQDGTGGRTFAWPTSVIDAPVMVGVALKCMDVSLWYDGANWRPRSATGGTLNAATIYNGLASLNLPAGAFSLTLPNATDTVVAKQTTDIFVNKTIDTSAPNTIKVAGTSLTATSGSGGTVALTNSPVFVTPNIGVATATAVQSATVNPAAAGVVRLAKTDAINFRNNANGADITAVSLNGSDQVVLPSLAATSSAVSFTAPAFISSTASPSTTGAVRLAVTDAVKIRDFTNSADIPFLSEVAGVLTCGDATHSCDNPGGSTATTYAASSGISTPSINMGGDTYTAAGRIAWDCFLPGALTSTWTACQFTPKKGITVVQVETSAKAGPSGCAPFPVVRVTDGSSNQDTTVNAAQVTNNIAGGQAYAANAVVQVKVTTAEAGCGVNGSDVNVTVQYKMQ